jgi:hypothetical protein
MICQISPFYPNIYAGMISDCPVRFHRLFNTFCDNANLLSHPDGPVHYCKGTRGCSRSFKYRRLCQPAVSSSTGSQQYIQRSQREINSSIRVRSLTEARQRSTPPNGHLYVTGIWNNIPSFRLAGGTACSASTYLKLLELSGHNTLSYSKVCHCNG